MVKGGGMMRIVKEDRDGACDQRGMYDTCGGKGRIVYRGEEPGKHFMEEL